MPSADVEQSYAAKMSQLQLRKNGARKKSIDSYSVASFDNDPPPISATSTNISTIQSNFGEDMELRLAPAMSGKPNGMNSFFIGLSISPITKVHTSLTRDVTARCSSETFHK